jgi:uncharacterized C2H2 Zn-finger protein
MALIAKKEVAALFLYCPHCDHELYALGGSLMFAHEDLTGEKVKCPDCDALIKLPDWRAKEARS